MHKKTHTENIIHRRSEKKFQHSRMKGKGRNFQTFFTNRKKRREKWNIILCYWIWNYVCDMLGRSSRILSAREWVEADCFYTGCTRESNGYGGRGAKWVGEWKQMDLGGEGNEGVEGMFFLIALRRQIWYDKHSRHVKRRYVMEGCEREKRL